MEAGLRPGFIRQFRRAIYRSVRSRAHWVLGRDDGLDPSAFEVAQDVVGAIVLVAHEHPG